MKSSGHSCCRGRKERGAVANIRLIKYNIKMNGGRGGCKLEESKRGGEASSDVDSLWTAGLSKKRGATLLSTQNIVVLHAIHNQAHRPT
mmetsp:Transcript_23062/g.70638  ORF Transcript_23062/g.70638 Transcript_23062/m.70638 type:complete len:89 (+) Transcript_23062:80-346(+)